MVEPDLKDKSYISEIIDKYKDLVYKIAYTMTCNIHDSEDVLQDVFFKFIKTSPNFNDENHEKAWFIRVTINRCKTLLASAWFKRTLSLNIDIPNDIEKDSEKFDLFTSVMNLPSKYKIIIHLYYYEDYSVKEISTILSIKESTIQSQLMRARSILRKNLEE